MVIVAAFLALLQVSFEEATLGRVPDGIVGPPVFSPDGRRVACWTRSGSQWRLDGKEPPVDARGAIVFSPDGSRLAYTAATKQVWRVVIEGKAGPAFASVTKPVFSPDSKHAAYWAQEKVPGPFALIIDQRETKQIEAEPPGAPVWSPDSKRVAYAVWRVEKGCVVIDGRRGAECVLPSDPVFSPDGRRVVYSAMRKGRTKQVIVGEARPLGESFDASGDPVWSADGRKVAYKASKGDKVFLAVGDRLFGDGYFTIDHLVFSPDGARVAYAANEGGDFSEDPAESDELATEKDNEILRRWERVKRDSSSNVKGGRWRMCVGDEKGEAFDGVGPPRFDPAGKTVAYRAVRGTKTIVVAGSKQSPEYDWAGDPVFSADGTKVAFGTVVEGAFRWTVRPVE